MQELTNLFCGFSFSIYIFLLVCIEIVTSSPTGKEMQDYLLHNIKLVELVSQQSSCPRGQFVVGIRKKTAKEMDAVNEIVTGLEVKCSDRIGSETQLSLLHMDKLGGTWGEYLECPLGFGVGLTLTVIYSRKDVMDRKVGNVTLHCSSVGGVDLMESILNTVSYEKEFGFSYNFAQFCVNDEAMTEVNIRANSEIQFYEGEKIKLKNVDIDCRRMEDYPASFCQFSIKWEKIPVQSCSDPYPDKEGEDSKYKVNCSFNARIGVDYNRDITNLQNILASYRLLDDFIQFHIRYILMLNMMNTKSEKDFPEEIDVPITQFLDNNNWQIDQIVSVNFSQPFLGPAFKDSLTKPRIQINDTFFDLNNEENVEQLIGVCGIYVFKFDKFRSQHVVYFKTVINDFPAKVTFVN